MIEMLAIERTVFTYKMLLGISESALTSNIACVPTNRELR